MLRTGLPQVNGHHTHHLHEIDAADLLGDGHDAELHYLPLVEREGYVVKGWVHLLAAYPRAGKSELLTAGAPAWLAMGERILFLSEEPKSIWRARLARLRGPLSGLRIAFALGCTPQQLLQRADAGEETVVIADTIRGLGILQGDECDNSAAAQSIAPWVALSRRRNLTVVLVHHCRKTAGEHGEAIAGGHALLGSVDIALQISRDFHPDRRIIRGFARVIQPSDLLYERTADGTFRALGSPACAGMAEVQRKVQAVVGTDWTTTKEVLARLVEPKPGAEVLRKALLAEAKAGFIERNPPLGEKGASGHTVRWRRKAP